MDFWNLNRKIDTVFILLLCLWHDTCSRSNSSPLQCLSHSVDHEIADAYHERNYNLYYTLIKLNNQLSKVPKCNPPPEATCGRAFCN